MLYTVKDGQKIVVADVSEPQVNVDWSIIDPNDPRCILHKPSFFVSLSSQSLIDWIIDPDLSNIPSGWAPINLNTNPNSFFTGDTENNRINNSLGGIFGSNTYPKVLTLNHDSPGEVIIPFRYDDSSPDYFRSVEGAPNHIECVETGKIKLDIFIMDTITCHVMTNNGKMCVLPIIPKRLNLYSNVGDAPSTRKLSLVLEMNARVQRSYFSRTLTYMSIMIDVTAGERLTFRLQNNDFSILPPPSAQDPVDSWLYNYHMVCDPDYTHVQMCYV